jgi:hypothetical protein
MDYHRNEGVEGVGYRRRVFNLEEWMDFFDVISIYLLRISRTGSIFDVYIYVFATRTRTKTLCITL